MWKRIRKFIRRRFPSKLTSTENQSRLWLLLLAAALLAYTALLVRHGYNLWQLDYFQFYPVFLVGVAILTVQRFRGSGQPPENVWRIEPVSMILGLAAIPIAVWMTSPKLAALSFWLVGNSLLCSNRPARQSWRLLAILIPLPLGYDGWLVQKLQQISSVNASVLLDAVDVPHLMQGNVLQLADKHFFVEEACSGISSIYLMLATTWFCLVWYNTRAIRAVPLLLSVFWWAIVANVVRIVSIAAAHHYWQTDLSTGTLHGLTGIAVLGFAFGMVFLTMQFLDFLFAPIGDGTVIRSDNKVSLELSPTVLWNLFTVSDSKVAHGVRQKLPLGINIQRRLLLYSLSIFLLVVGTAHLGLAYAPTLFNRDELSAQQPVTVNATDSIALKSLDGSLFENVDGMREVVLQEQNADTEADSQSAVETLRTWAAVTDSGEIQISLNGPFANWHSPRLSHEETGWKIVQAEAASIGLVPEDNMVTMRLIDDQGQSATLRYCQFRSSGHLLPIPLDGPTDNVMSSLRNRLNNATVGEQKTSTWHFQVLFKGSKRAFEAESPQEQSQFEALLRIILDHWRQSR